MNNIFKMLKSSNKGHYGWLIMWSVSVTTFLGCDGFKYIAAALLAGAVVLYVDKFTSFFVRSGEEGSKFDARRSIIDTMRYHSFDAGRYFLKLCRTFIPVQLISLLITGALIITKIYGHKDGFILLILITVIPEIVFGIRYLTVRYILSHSEESKYLFGAVNVLIKFLMFLGFIICSVVLILVTAAIPSSAIMMKNIDQESVIRIGSDTGVFIVLIVASGLAMLVLALDILPVVTSAKKKFQVIGAVVFVLSITAFCIFGTQKHIVISEDSFLVKNFGYEKEYSYDEVKNYRVYADEQSSFQMELTFDDDKSYKLFLGTADDTEGWKERFATDYDYAVFLAGKLKDKGISGELQDPEKLEELVSGMDKSCRAAYVELAEIMQ